MQYYTISNLKQDVNSNLHAGGLSELQNFYNTVDKGRRMMVGKIRPEELIRKTYLEEALYPDVEKYAAPEDLKYSDIIELKMLPAYRSVDTMNQPMMLVYRRRFGQKRDFAKNVVNIGYENGVKYVRVMRPSGLSYSRLFNEGTIFVRIHDCNSLTDNGTWNTGGNVVDLELDELNRIAGTGSLKFNINNSSTTGFIENFTLDTFDISEAFERGATFAWLNVPLPNELISVKLTMGSNTTNLTTDLYTSTVDQPHDNNEFTTGWNLLKYMLNNLNTIGSPNPKELAYIRFDFTTTGEAIPECRLDNILVRRGQVYEITYNSPYIIMDATTGAFKKFATKDSDIIVAEEDTYNILMLETTLQAQKEIYGNADAAKSDVYDVEKILRDSYDKYLKEHKSEALMTEDSNYIFGNFMEGNWSDTPLDTGYDYYDGYDGFSNF